ncbi:MAG TPA: 16S rRNA (adenine(1518)-N(6)/adenine(1519)-N(6))-dimethyltransferase RsmA [Fervidobacterium sp.]|nr:16S rRNA (adenine(1518)-N(6)/adenine(1519)-N(6))-dimethyltransferase RsmA [Fervidobacterium sp.]
MKRSLGQNFLSSEEYANRIVEASDIKKDDTILEIGAGAGTLTLSLAMTGAKVYAIEIDKRMEPILKERLAEYNNVHLIFEDFFNVDISFLPNQYKCISNIPYYITAPIIKRLIFTNFNVLYLMMQKEVGERLQEKPGSSNRGFLSVVLQTVADLEKVMIVPRSAFVPNPEIDSIVLKIEKNSSIPFMSLEELSSYWDFVSSCFGQKRKTIYNNLRAIGLDKSMIEEMLDGISPSARPEQLTNDEFVSMWHKWRELKTLSNGGAL